MERKEELEETQPHLKSKHVNFLAFSEAFCTESVLSSEISSIHTLLHSFNKYEMQKSLGFRS